MLVTSGYKAEILKLHTPLRRTMEISRRAVGWLKPVIDREFPKMPSYLRRAILQHVLGLVSSSRGKREGGSP